MTSDTPRADAHFGVLGIKQVRGTESDLIFARTLERELAAVRDLLRSAHAIAERKGERTAWDRFAASCLKLGVGAVTARTYKILPSDEESSNDK